MNAAYFGLMTPTAVPPNCGMFPGMPHRYYCGPQTPNAPYQDNASPSILTAPLQSSIPFYACTQQVFMPGPRPMHSYHIHMASPLSEGGPGPLAHSGSPPALAPCKAEKDAKRMSLFGGGNPSSPPAPADALAACCIGTHHPSDTDASPRMGYVSREETVAEAEDPCGRSYLSGRGAAHHHHQPPPPPPPPLYHEAEQGVPVYATEYIPTVPLDSQRRWPPELKAHPLPSSSSSSAPGDMFPSRNSCHVCGKTYARQSTLKTHLRTHNGEKPYQCNVCHKSFTQAANLTAHIRTHSGEKPFKCPVCGRGFSQSSSVTTHMRTHSGDRPYKCSVCVKGFADSSTLTKHYRTHTGEKPYNCKVCEARFSQSGNLNRHMRTHRSYYSEEAKRMSS